MTANFKDSPRFSNIVALDKDESVINTMGNNQNVEEGIDDIHKREGDEMPEISGPLNWQRFYALCGQAVNEQSNKIKSQLRCAHLEGMDVIWMGTVTQVHISRVSNIRAEYINRYLPTWLSHFISCIYGTYVRKQLQCDAEEKEVFCRDIDILLKHSALQGKCSLHHWNTYEYEIRVRMPTQGLLSKSIDIVLQASHKFGNFTRALMVGDRLQFYGILQNNLPPLANGMRKREDFIFGDSHTRIQLLAVKCVQCFDKRLKTVNVERKSPLNARMRDLMRGFKYLLNVLFNPLITFK